MAREKKNVNDVRPVYEAPKVMRLDGTRKSMGDCVGAGSGDVQDCITNGNGAMQACYANGIGAIGDCDSSGNSPTTCLTVGSGF